MYYGQFEAAPEALEQGQMNYLRTMDQLYLDQMPVMLFGEPLA